MPAEESKKRTKIIIIVIIIYLMQKIIPKQVQLIGIKKK